MDGKRAVRTLTVIVEDITERIQLEEQLLNAKKMESLGILAGGIAHEFNNILTSVSGNARLAFEEYGLIPRLSDYLYEIEMGSDRITALVKQVLAFSMRQMLRPKYIDINELLITGYSSDMVDKDFIEKNGLRILKKPFTPQAILQTLSEMLDRK